MLRATKYCAKNEFPGLLSPTNGSKMLEKYILHLFIGTLPFQSVILGNLPGVPELFSL